MAAGVIVVRRRITDPVLESRDGARWVCMLDRAEEGVEHDPHIAHVEVEHRQNENAPAFVRIRILPGQLTAS